VSSLPFGRRFYFSPAMRAELETRMQACDVVHLHSVFLWPAWAAARVARGHGIPYVISPRGMLVPELIRQKSRIAKTAWIELLEKKTFRHAAGIHFTAQREWDDARRVVIPLPDPFIVPNGIDLPPASASARHSNTLLFLGRINWKKGLDRLLDAARNLPEVNIVIAGNDEENLTPALRALARRNGMEARVDFRGPVEGAAKEELLRTATAMVLPSLSENFGNVVLEAMAAGMPVIVTPEVGLASDVAEAGAGIVSSNDPEVLGGAIQRLLHDRQACESMGRKGRELVAARFTWDRVAVQMEEHYRRIASNRGRP
jgi:glycosyltransferase involved in cell wall biosynthesis